MRNSSLINFPPVSQEAEGWRKKTLLSVSRRYYIKYNHAPRVFHHALTFHSAIYTCPKGITITDSAQHSISLEKLLSRWCFSFRRHLTHKDWLTGYRAAPNFLNSSSKHRFHYSKCCFTSHGLFPFLPSTHINWTKVPSKSGPAITGKQHYTVSLHRGPRQESPALPMGRASTDHPGCWKLRRHRPVTLLWQQPYLVQDTSFPAKKQQSTD